MKLFDAVVIGGGLAGSAAATLLAQRGHEVLLLEKKEAPHHKLCGEFLSPEVAATLGRLGALEAVHEAGAHPMRRALLTAASGVRFATELPGTALGLSRYTLDPLLQRRAECAGATVWRGAQARALEGSLEEGFVVEVPDGTVRARMVLAAYGKRSRLDGRLARSFLQRPAPRVAFKAHYEGVDVEDRIELHAFPGGYCGLSMVEGGRMNACWIAHEDVLREAGGSPEEMETHALAQNPALAERLRRADRVLPNYAATSQVTFAYKGTWAGDALMLGDAAAMIAPLCGDGMAMALRSAELAAPAVSNFLRGRTDASSLRMRYTRAWKREFAVRLAVGRAGHALFCQPALATAGVQACRVVPGFGRWLIRATRG